MFKRVLFFSLITLFSIYTMIVYNQGTEYKTGEALFTPEAVRGKITFQEHNCTSCHQLYGLGGYMGPDLTNTISRSGELVVRAYLKTGTQKMPNFNLTDQEIDNIVSFLTYVDKTGQYPVTDFQTTWYGTNVY